MTATLLKSKKGLVTGITNRRSIAYGIAKILSEHGAELAITYQNETVKERLLPIAIELNVELVLSCDVANEVTIDAVFKAVEKKWGTLDFLVHAIAFSDKSELSSKYVNTSLNNFLNAMHISCYSFTALAQRAEKMMRNIGSLLTLSYYGAEKVIPNYNVMGLCKAALEASVKYLAYDLGPKNIRVNAISAGPVRTLASSGISDFHFISKWNKNNAPLRRNVTIEDIGKAALYLLSDLSSGTTGEILHVDSGYNIVGMKVIDSN
ncbi:SDR family oxidoreductase [Wolbachia endosymbiont of Cruorifilaria tuberocauda]|uniref:enoyl-ACP reductase FabI n=1 Tax=Wolbachia endosymbiont of Cruorifilaria tuberocauda TaxID=1812111 RepID=UPI001589B791|nr:SDR family oxidoreductase [Wolbachia endosymbiont of Cruorifilaria tuberocauda]QKX01562.1 SDR family oxidoreductase [Wolbachia endosymbiont of Cruorifilaria tuberocauda]